MTNQPIRILVLGASGMLGNAVLSLFAQSTGYQTFGSVRSMNAMRLLPQKLQQHIVTGVDVENSDSLHHLFARVRPNFVINCIGLVKQLAIADSPLSALPINAMLPHRLAQICEIAGARLIHMSTDCVFSGDKGMYIETDVADATDLYGRSKHMGEVDYPNAITLRTSIIGHELDGARSLIGWFLSQQGSTKGFRRAIFSGLPTFEIARIIRDFVIPHPELRGLYHVSAEPINKYELLSLVAQTYQKHIEIIPDDSFTIDRSLNSERFRLATAYTPPEWPTLIKQMFEFNKEFSQ